MAWYKEATHENKWNFATDTVPAKTLLCMLNGFCVSMM